MKNSFVQSAQMSERCVHGMQERDGGSAVCRLDLVDLLSVDVGRLPQGLCRYLCEVFPTSLFPIELANLEITLNEDILC